MTLLELFVSFLQVGALSIGGGYAAIPLIKSQVVERHAWLTMAEFTNLVTIAEMTPGPITINAASFVGVRIEGLLGAVVATLGCILPAVFLVSLLAVLYKRYHGLSLVSSVLASLRPAVVALIASAGLSILSQVVWMGEAAAIENVQWIETALFVIAFILLRRLKWNPILTIAACGGAGLMLHITLGR